MTYQVPESGIYGGITKNLAEALAVMQQLLPKLGKDRVAIIRDKSGNETYRYSFAGLADVNEVLLPLLGSLGLSFTCWPTLDDGKMVLRYELLHVSGENRVGLYPLSGTGTPQSMGSAITFAKRYAILAVTGLAPDEDDDAAKAQAETEARPPSAQRAARKTTGRKVARPGPGEQQPDGDSGPEAGMSEVAMMNAQQRGLLYATVGRMSLQRDEGLEVINAGLASAGIALITSTRELTHDAAKVAIDVLLAEEDLRAAGVAPPAPDGQ